jgi:hypothetical protein
VRDARGEFHHLDATCDFALGVGENLSVLLCDDAGEFVRVPPQEFAELHQDARSRERGRFGPTLKRCLSRPDGVVDFLRSTQEDTPEMRARGWVTDLGSGARP